MFTDLNDVANVLAVTALLPIGLFVFYYGTKRVPGKKLRRFSTLWTTTPIGRVLMTQKISWFVFLCFVLVGIFSPPYAAEGPVRLLVYALLVSQFWLVFATLRRIQKTVQPPTNNTETEEPKEHHKEKVSTDSIPVDHD